MGYLRSQSGGGEPARFTGSTCLGVEVFVSPARRQAGFELRRPVRVPPRAVLCHRGRQCCPARSYRLHPLPGVGRFGLGSVADSARCDSARIRGVHDDADSLVGAWPVLRCTGLQLAAGHRAAKDRRIHGRGRRAFPSSQAQLLGNGDPDSADHGVDHAEHVPAIRHARAEAPAHAASRERPAVCGRGRRAGRNIGCPHDSAE